MEAVLRVSEIKMNGHVYHRLLVPKNVSRRYSLRHNDRVVLDIIKIERPSNDDDVQAGPGNQQHPLAMFLRPDLERE